MSQTRFAGTAEVIEEDYYEYDIPPNLTIRLDIDSHVYRLVLRGEAKSNSDKWYNDTYVTEIIGGHV